MRKQYNFWPWPTDGPSDAWDVDHLVELSRDLPVKQVSLDSIWQLDTQHWRSAVTPRDLADHIRLVRDTDLAHPIILSADGRVMDGMHRVVKALLEGRDMISAVQFDVQPEPDHRDVRPEDLSYEETSRIERSLDGPLDRLPRCSTERSVKPVPGPRTPEQRRDDTLAKLTAPELDVWVATASASGPHLVPLSGAWDGERLIIATEPEATTTRNLATTGRARVAVGATRDVVLIDIEVIESMPADAADDAAIETYIEQSRWDPRNAGTAFVVHLLRPIRILAWREVDEIPGRTLMRAGQWLV